MRMPAYVCLLIAVVVVTQFWLGRAIFNPGYWNSLARAFVSFLAVLALGQGTVILTGGLDLSVPWVIGICGIILAGVGQRLGRRTRLCPAARAPDGAGDRLLQWRRHRLSRHLPDRHDARHERHPARFRAALFAGHAGRLLLADAALVHDRQDCRHHAGRVLLHRRFAWGWPCCCSAARHSAGASTASATGCARRGSPASPSRRR
jgi:ribose/xylose/arabinose/galactoside ABC-type transport system permease subunit